MTQKQSLGIDYYKGLDILRFVAASGVVLFHANIFLVENGFKSAINKHYYYTGSFFLDLFFVISGFLIALILFKEIDSHQFSIKKFFIRRIFRIWPLFFFIVIGRLIIFPIIIGVDYNEILYNLKYALTFTTNLQLIFGENYESTYQILWSVCVEEHIYLIFPFFVLIFKQNRYLMISVLIILGIASIRYSEAIFDNATGLSISYLFTISYFYYFGLGALLAILLTKNPLLFHKMAQIIGFWGVQLVFITIGLLFVFDCLIDSRYTTDGLTILNGLFATYLVFLAISKKLLFDKLGIKASRFLGNISYAMYLVHPMLLGLSFYIISETNKESTSLKLIYGFPFLTIVLTIIASTVLYYIIERPFLKIKKKYTVIKNR